MCILVISLTITEDGLFTEVHVLYFVQNYYSFSDTPNIFVVSYESLKREPSKLINKIAKFLGYDLTEDAIARIVEATSFDKMKENPSANNSWMNEYRREGAPFMRKGIIGDWKNLFSKDQSAQVDEMIAEKLQDVNVTFDFGD